MPTTLYCCYYGTATHTASSSYQGHADVLGTWSASASGQVAPQQCCGGCAAYLASQSPYYITALEFQQRIFTQVPGFTMKLIRMSLAQSLQTAGIINGTQAAAFMAASTAVDSLMDMIDQSGGATEVDLNPATSTGQLTVGGIDACVSAGLMTQAQANIILSMS